MILISYFFWVIIKNILGAIRQPETNCYPPIQGPPDIINGGLKLPPKSGLNPMAGQAIQLPTHIQNGLIGNQVRLI